jgi:hypothetical protein
MRAAISLMLVAGCFSVDLGNGGQYKCATSGKACPEGYYCFSGDNHCYKNGFTPGSEPDLSGSAGEDLATTADLSVAPDLTTLDLYGATFFTVTGSTTAYELDAMSVMVTATTHSGSSVTLAASNLPMGASFNAATGTLTWTPAYTQAGVYNVKIDATAVDPAENGTYMLTLTVKNFIDPLILPDGSNPPSVYSIALVDFDKDGFGDVAICTSDAVNSLYQVRILYGDATGLPLSTPYPAGRTKLYTFTSGANPIANPTCIGADYDGDGYGDVVVADGTATGAATRSGRIFVMFGVPHLTDTAPTIELLPPAPTVNMQMGYYYITVGDFDGDTKSDVATMPVSGAGSNGTDDRHFIWKGGARSNNSSPVVYNPPSGPCSSTAGGVSNFGDVNQDGKEELLVWDFNIGLTTCGADGVGLRVLDGTTSTTPSPHPYLHSTGRTGATGYYGMNNSVLCDVDHDGKADLVILDNVGAYAFWGSASGLMASSPLDLTGLSAITTPAGNSNLRCVKSFFGSSTLLHGATGKVEIISGGNRTPTVTRTINTPDATETQFGEWIIRGSTDVNGDGKQDIAVGGISRAGKFYVIYGQ